MLPIDAQVSGDDNGDQPAPAVWLVGAHGGAGVSTLSHILAPMGDAGQAWPAGVENPYCVLVCRSTKVGLERAHQAALQARAGQAGDVMLLGIAIVADAPGKMPKALARKVGVIEQHFRIWRIPYLDAIRVTDMDELAVWEPGYEMPERKKRSRRKTPPITDVPAVEVITVAEAIFDSALEAHELAEPAT